MLIRASTEGKSVYGCLYVCMSTYGLYNQLTLYIIKYFMSSIENKLELISFLSHINEAWFHPINWQAMCKCLKLAHDQLGFDHCPLTPIRWRLGRGYMIKKKGVKSTNWWNILNSTSTTERVAFEELKYTNSVSSIGCGGNGVEYWVSSYIKSSKIYASVVRVQIDKTSLCADRCAHKPY